MITHQDALDDIAVKKPKEILAGAVELRALYLHRLQGRIVVFLFQKLSQGFREIAHLLEASGQLSVHPVVDLLRPECFLSPRLKLFLQLLQGQGFDICSFHIHDVAVFLNFAIKKPSQAWMPGSSCRYPCFVVSL